MDALGYPSKPDNSRKMLMNKLMDGKHEPGDINELRFAFVARTVLGAFVQVWNFIS